MSESIVSRLLVEQRRRLLASVLNAVEQETDPRLRKDRIVAAINSFYDLTRDVIKVCDDDFVRNENALQLIVAVHESQRRLERRAG